MLVNAGILPSGPTWGIWKQEKKTWAQFATVSNITQLKKKNPGRRRVYLRAMYARFYSFLSNWLAFELANGTGPVAFFFWIVETHCFLLVFFIHCWYLLVVVYSCGCVVHIACVLALCVLLRQKLCFLVCSSINSWCWNTVAMSMSMFISRFNRSMAKSWGGCSPSMNMSTNIHTTLKKILATTNRKRGLGKLFKRSSM